MTRNQDFSEQHQEINFAQLFPNVNLKHSSKLFLLDQVTSTDNSVKSRICSQITSLDQPNPTNEL